MNTLFHEWNESECLFEQHYKQSGIALETPDCLLNRKEKLLLLQPLNDRSLFKCAKKRGANSELDRFRSYQRND